eukprot:gene6484-8917_t
MRRIKFYFDPISPYSYFAFHQLKVLSNNHHIEVIPILFAGLLNEHKNKGPAEIIPKRKYIFSDCMRLSKLHKIPFVMPPAHPFNPLLPLRMSSAIDDHKTRYNFSSLLVSECWGKGSDITNSSNLLEVAAQCGINGRYLFEKAMSDEIKSKVRYDTNQAILKGVFGVPSFIVHNNENNNQDNNDDNNKNELFWGSDRIQHLNEYLLGTLSIDHTELERMLKHPRGADRKNQ